MESVTVPDNDLITTTATETTTETAATTTTETAATTTTTGEAIITSITTTTTPTPTPTTTPTKEGTVNGKSDDSTNDVSANSAVEVEPMDTSEQLTTETTKEDLEDIRSELIKNEETKSRSSEPDPREIPMWRFQQCICCQKGRSEKLLSCLHPVCNRCLPGIQENDESFRCPVCKDPMTEGVDNVFISMTATESVKECNWCLDLEEHTPAVSHCQECDHWLCKECLRGHNRNPGFRSHAVDLQAQDQGEETLLNCSEHRKEPLQLFCEACLVLTCRECQLTRHNGHKHQWVGEKVREVESSIQEASRKLDIRKEVLEEGMKATEAALTTLIENEQTARQALQTCAEKLAMFVKLWFDELDNCMKYEILSRREKLESVRNNIKSILSQLQYTESLVSILLKNISPAGIIHISSPLKKRMGQLADSGQESRLHWMEACTHVKFEQTRDPCAAVRHIGRLMSAPYDPEGPPPTPDERENSNDLRELAVPQIANVTSTIVNRRDPPLLSGPGEPGIGAPPPLAGPGSSHGASNGSDGGQGAVSSSSPPPILMAPNHNPNDPHMDYCCVCYDSGDLICCNLCDHVYHARCHLPALQTVPKDDWICTLCLPPQHIVITGEEYSKNSPGKLSKKQRLAAYHILLRLFEDPSGVEFIYPVEPTCKDANGVPYKRVVSDPMDLTTVRERLESRQYDDLDNFLNDLQLIFTNCFKFNQGPAKANTEIFEKGKTLEFKFHQLVSLLLPYTETNPDSRFKAKKRAV